MKPILPKATEMFVLVSPHILVSVQSVPMAVTMFTIAHTTLNKVSTKSMVDTVSSLHYSQGKQR